MLTLCLHYSEWPTIPQIYLKGEFIGGCDIILGMHQSGELTSVRRLSATKSNASLTWSTLQMLQEKDVLPKEQAQPTDAGAS
jgi:monothiol glutaredoxin